MRMHKCRPHSFDNNLKVQLHMQGLFRIKEDPYDYEVDVPRASAPSAKAQKKQVCKHSTVKLHACRDALLSGLCTSSILQASAHLI